MELSLSMNNLKHVCLVSYLLSLFSLSLFVMSGLSEWVAGCGYPCCSAGSSFSRVHVRKSPHCPVGPFVN